jgi:hypothetical protein
MSSGAFGVLIMRPYAAIGRLGACKLRWYRRNMLLRSLIITLFSAVLALTSVTLAVAQHGTAGGRSLVLCTDAGERLVTLDAQGNPVPMLHPCPDCVAAMTPQDVPADMALPQPPLTAQMQAALTYAAAETGRAVQAPRARGPPFWMM